MHNRLKGRQGLLHEDPTFLITSKGGKNSSISNQHFIASKDGKDSSLRIHHFIASKGDKDTSMGIQNFITSKGGKYSSMRFQNFIGSEGSKDSSIRIYHFITSRDGFVQISFLQFPKNKGETKIQITQNNIMRSLVKNPYPHYWEPRKIVLPHKGKLSLQMAEV